MRGLFWACALLSASSAHAAPRDRDEAPVAERPGERRGELRRGPERRRVPRQPAEEVPVRRPVQREPVARTPIERRPAAGPPPRRAEPAPRAEAPRRGPTATPRAGGMVLPAVSPAHGLFLFGPALGTHQSYAGDGPQRVAKKDLPKRAVDRGGSLAVGLKGGVYGSSTPDASAVYADPGAGLTLRYRPVEFLGIEGTASHFLGTAGLETGEPLRTSTPLAGSLQVFAFPWSRVSPFGTLGATANLAGASLIGTPDEKPEATLWGPHLGLGLEIAVGQSVAFDLDGRFNWLVNAAEQGASPASLTAGLGMLLHF